MKIWLHACLGFGLAGLAVTSNVAAAAQEANMDWPNLKAYREANRQLGALSDAMARTVFMGDSITEFWPADFWRAGRINRGISGQTSAQMLLRFRADVIELKPKVVVILAGTNDVAGNTGLATIDMIVGNIASMAELAQVHGIKVVLCSVLPASRFYWNESVRPANEILELNRKIQAYAQKNNLAYVDYHSKMAGIDKGLPIDYSADGVHPNKSGYELMQAQVLPALSELMKGDAP